MTHSPNYWQLVALELVAKQAASGGTLQWSSVHRVVSSWCLSAQSCFLYAKTSVFLKTTCCYQASWSAAHPKKSHWAKKRWRDLVGTHLALISEDPLKKMPILRVPRKIDDVFSHQISRFLTIFHLFGRCRVRGSQDQSMKPGSRARSTHPPCPRNGLAAAGSVAMLR